MYGKTFGPYHYILGWFDRTSIYNLVLDHKFQHTCSRRLSLPVWTERSRRALVLYDYFFSYLNHTCTMKPSLRGNGRKGTRSTERTFAPGSLVRLGRMARPLAPVRTFHTLAKHTFGDYGFFVLHRATYVQPGDFCSE